MCNEQKANCIECPNQTIISQIEDCNFNCVAGNLKNHRGWMELKKRLTAVGNIRDGKYQVSNGRLVNIKTGVPISDDEPVFIFRAKDVHAVEVLEYYMYLCNDHKQSNAVMNRITEFEDWSNCNLGKMKEPDC